VDSTTWKAHSDTVNYNNPDFAAIEDAEAFSAVVAKLWLTVQSKADVASSHSLLKSILLRTCMWNIKQCLSALTVFKQRESHVAIRDMI
jgi:hypothetical protein